MKFILPVGSVVTLQGSELPVMIAGYTLDPGSKQMNGYYVMEYPMGIEGPRGLVVVPEGKIDRLVNMGFQSRIFEEWKNKLCANNSEVQENE